MIENKTRKRQLSEDMKICKSLFSKSLGLMFSRYKKPLVFVYDKEEHVALHMWFVFYAIDVLYLDKDKKVVEMKQGFKPFKFFNPRCKAKYVIEFKSGIIRDKGVKIGDVISF